MIAKDHLHADIADRDWRPLLARADERFLRQRQGLRHRGELQWVLQIRDSTFSGKMSQIREFREFPYLPFLTSRAGKGSFLCKLALKYIF